MQGVLADVSPTENRQIGQQSFRMAACPLGFGLLALLAGLLLLRASPK